MGARPQERGDDMKTVENPWHDANNPLSPPRFLLDLPEGREEDVEFFRIRDEGTEGVLAVRDGIALTLCVTKEGCLSLLNQKKESDILDRIDTLLAKLADLDHVDEVRRVREVLDREFEGV